MKHSALLVACLLTLAATALAAAPAGAQDTSPYLVGTWEDSSVISATWYEIINPTTRPLDVYMAWYLPDGTFNGCISTFVSANGSLSFGLGMGNNGETGAVKFFAFPRGSTKFDSNAVIGGFQRKNLNGDPLEPSPYEFNAEANLKAVTINSYTLGEFTQMPANCTGSF
jgi:hypothetical protein